jgi:hypothetical protein
MMVAFSRKQVACAVLAYFRYGALDTWGVN